MDSSLSIPTDNIYKFCAISGLALLLASILGFVFVYDSHLEKKITYKERIIKLEAKEIKTKEDIETREMYVTLLKVTRENESLYINLLGGIIGISIMLSGIGITKWHNVVQKREDELFNLQLMKLKQEVHKPLTSQSSRRLRRG